MKKEKITSLIKLYLNYIFSKTTLFIFGLSLILMVLILIILANPNLDNIDYLISHKDIHKSFFEQAIFVINVFNGIIITTLVISIIINSISFDSLFISYIKRSKICIAKMLACLVVILELVLFEFLIIYLIPIIKYDLYKPNISDFSIIFMLLLNLLFILMLEILVTTLVSSIFMPMIILFITIITQIIVNSSSLAKDFIGSIIPLIGVNHDGLYGTGYIPGIILIILFTFLYFSVYNIKDLELN